MALLIFALIASYVVSAIFLAEMGLFAWLAALVAVPIAYAIGYALSRVLRGAGVL